MLTADTNTADETDDNVETLEVENLAETYPATHANTVNLPRS